MNKHRMLYPEREGNDITSATKCEKYIETRELFQSNIWLRGFMQSSMWGQRTWAVYLHNRKSRDAITFAVVIEI